MKFIIALTGIALASSLKATPNEQIDRESFLCPIHIEHKIKYNKKYINFIESSKCSPKSINLYPEPEKSYIKGICSAEEKQNISPPPLDYYISSYKNGFKISLSAILYDKIKNNKKLEKIVLKDINDPLVLFWATINNIKYYTILGKDPSDEIVSLINNMSYKNTPALVYLSYIFENGLYGTPANEKYSTMLRLFIFSEEKKEPNKLYKNWISCFRKLSILENTE